MIETRGTLLPPPSPSPDNTYSWLSQVRQTFLEPVEWQISEIRSAFSRALPKAFLGNFSENYLNTKNKRRRGSGGPAMIELPRPSVMAEIIRGSSLLSPPRLSPRDNFSSSSGHARVLSEGEGQEGGGRGDDDRERKRDINSNSSSKDFEFRETFAVYEDRDLLGCPPLREVQRAVFYLYFLFRFYFQLWSTQKEEEPCGMIIIVSCVTG